jgi:uncharacterized membrane protein
MHHIYTFYLESTPKKFFQMIAPIYTTSHKVYENSSVLDPTGSNIPIPFHFRQSMGVWKYLTVV